MVRVSHPHASTAYTILQCASSPTCYSHDWPSESVKTNVVLSHPKIKNAMVHLSPFSTVEQEWLFVCVNASEHGGLQALQMHISQEDDTMTMANIVLEDCTLSLPLGKQYFHG